MFPMSQGVSLATAADMDLSRGMKALGIGIEGQGSEQLQGTPRDQLDTQLLKDSSAAPDQGGIFPSDGQIDLQQLVASLHKIKTHNMQVSASHDAQASGTGIAGSLHTSMPLTNQPLASQDSSMLLQQRLREDTYLPLSNHGSLDSQRVQEVQSRSILSSQVTYPSSGAELQNATDASQQKEVQVGSDAQAQKSTSEQESQPPTPKSAMLPDEFVQQLKPHVTCKICHGVLSSAMVLSCGHSFCAFCLFKWLTENQTCPRCPVGLRSLPSRCTALDAVVSLLVPSLPPSEQEHYLMRKTESETACSKVTKLFWHIAQGGSVSPMAQPQQQANKLRFAPNPSQHLTQQLQQGQMLLGPGQMRLNTHIPQHTLTNQAAARMMSQAGGYSSQVGMQMNMGAGLQLPSTVTASQTMFGGQQQIPLQMVQPVANMQSAQAANMSMFPVYEQAGAASIAAQQQQQQQQLLLQSNAAAGAWSQQMPSNMQLLYGNGHLGSAAQQWAPQGRR